MRLNKGDVFILSNGKGDDARVRLVTLKKEYGEVVIEEVSQNTKDPGKHVFLYCSLLKRENFELMVQKTTESGVYTIIPIISERTVKQRIRYDRVERIAKEAAEQCGRSVVPVITETIEFETALQALSRYDDAILFDATADDVCFKEHKIKRIAIFIGPEGGWDEEEVCQAREAGCRIVTLGMRTLRAETAAIVATFLVAADESVGLFRT
ncbi:MAG: 16S rRNA (uracil(1498)-N(3))-methyltransferase [bacterium]